MSSFPVILYLDAKKLVKQIFETPSFLDIGSNSTRSQNCRIYDPLVFYAQTYQIVIQPLADYNGVGIDVIE